MSAYSLTTAAETHYATPELVACPTCSAPGGQPCRSRRTHSARISRAISGHQRDESRQHERVWRALGRIRQAVGRGTVPAAADITTALGSCGCAGCRAQVRPLAVELAPWLNDGATK